MNKPDTQRLADGLCAQTSAFAAAITGLDPRMVVPTCPEWRLRDLVAHIGQAHRWSAGIVRTGTGSAVPDPLAADPGPVEGWPGWLRAGAAELADAIQGTGPDTVVWTFLGERAAGFWLRRMLHDTTVHHADAALLAGIEFTVEPDLAADAISELLDLLSEPGVEKLRPDLAELRGHGQTIALHAAEADLPGWLITRTPEGVRWERRTADGDLTLRGPVRDLVLVLSRRSAPADVPVAVDGDAGLFTHWLASTVF